MITRRLAVVVAGAMVVLSACSSNPSAPAGGSGGTATGCTVGVSWNNYSQERWKKADEPAMQKAIAAKGGKYIRAEPVSTLYGEGRVIHVGEFPELERQMCDFAADGLSHGKSPDRLDALVWAITELMLAQRSNPSIRVT